MSGAANFSLFGAGSTLALAVYVPVGLSAIEELVMHKKLSLLQLERDVE